MNSPNYVVKYSALPAITFWRIILCFLVIPLIVMIVDIIVRKNSTIEFYDDYVIQKSGVLSKRQTRTAFTGAAGVSVNQTLWQRLFGYGDVHIDVLGKWDIDAKGVVNPQGLQEYLQTKLVKVNQVNNMMVN